MLPWVCMWAVIVEFPGRPHLLVIAEFYLLNRYNPLGRGLKVHLWRGVETHYLEYSVMIRPQNSPNITKHVA